MAFTEVTPLNHMAEVQRRMEGWALASVGELWGRCVYNNTGIVWVIQWYCYVQRLASENRARRRNKAHETLSVLWYSRRWRNHWSFIIRFDTTEHEVIVSQQHRELLLQCNTTHTHNAYTHFYTIPASSWVDKSVCSQLSPQATSLVLFNIYTLILTSWCGRQQISVSSFVLSLAIEQRDCNSCSFCALDSDQCSENRQEVTG